MKIMKIARFGMLAVVAVAVLALYGCGSGYMSEWPGELGREVTGCQEGQMVGVRIEGSLPAKNEVNIAKTLLWGTRESDVDSGTICLLQSVDRGEYNLWDVKFIDKDGLNVTSAIAEIVHGAAVPAGAAFIRITEEDVGPDRHSFTIEGQVSCVLLNAKNVVGMKVEMLSDQLHIIEGLVQGTEFTVAQTDIVAVEDRDHALGLFDLIWNVAGVVPMESYGHAAFLKDVMLTATIDVESEWNTGGLTGFHAAMLDDEYLGHLFETNYAQRVFMCEERGVAEECISYRAYRIEAATRLFPGLVDVVGATELVAYSGADLNVMIGVEQLLKGQDQQGKLKFLAAHAILGYLDAAPWHEYFMADIITDADLVNLFDDALLAAPAPELCAPCGCPDPDTGDYDPECVRVDT